MIDVQVGTGTWSQQNATPDNYKMAGFHFGKTMKWIDDVRYLPEWQKLDTSTIETYFAIAKDNVEFKINMLRLDLQKVKLIDPQPKRLYL